MKTSLSRVGDCSSTIVLCDPWRRLTTSCVLVETSVGTLDGGQATEPGPNNISERNSSIVVAVAALAVAAAVVAAVPVDVGQSGVSRGRE